jgi:hypothetical protein
MGGGVFGCHVCGGKVFGFDVFDGAVFGCHVRDGKVFGFDIFDGAVFGCQVRGGEVFASEVCGAVVSACIVPRDCGCACANKSTVLARSAERRVFILSFCVY